MVLIFSGHSIHILIQSSFIVFIISYSITVFYCVRQGSTRAWAIFLDPPLGYHLLDPPLIWYTFSLFFFPHRHIITCFPLVLLPPVIVRRSSSSLLEPVFLQLVCGRVSFSCSLATCASIFFTDKITPLQYMSFFLLPRI